MGTTFKETKIGQIPADWKLVKFEDIGVTYGGLTNKNKGDFGKGKPYIPFLNIMNNAKIDLDYFDYVDVQEGEKQNRAKKGDLFFNTSSETPEEVGMCSVLCDDVSELYLNSFCFGFRIEDQNSLLPLFVSYFFRSGVGRKVIFPLAQGMTRYNLSKRYFLQLEIPKPKTEEQRKIVDILSTVDEAIMNTEAVIEETQQLKKGLIQKLFTEGIGHTRFRKTILADVEKPIAQRGHQLKQFRILPQDWDIVRCGKVFSLEYGKGLAESGRDGGDFPVVGSAGIVGHHSQKLVVGPGIVVGRKGGAGIVTHVKDDFWPIDTAYFVKLTGKHDVDWLYYILNFLKLTRLGEGTVPGLNRTDVYHLYIPLPPLPEQRQIAEILSEVDAKIETEEAYKSELEQLKTGLMQVLLTGKVRVKV